MSNLRSIRWKQKLVSTFPSVSRLSEILHFIQFSKTWRKEGWTSPPPYFVRRAMLRSEALGIGAEIFVETGTFLGDTSWAFINEFKNIHTLEVEPNLAALARERFKRHPSVTVMEGDSSLLLPELCARLEAPCLFFLDGHYSGGITGMGSEECPILTELTAIFTNTRQPFRIVIDDARLFGTDPSYPSVEDLRQFLKDLGAEPQLRIENDAILIS